MPYPTGVAGYDSAVVKAELAFSEFKTLRQPGSGYSGIENLPAGSDRGRNGEWCRDRE